VNRNDRRRKGARGSGREDKLRVLRDDKWEIALSIAIAAAGAGMGAANPMVGCASSSTTTSDAGAKAPGDSGPTSTPSDSGADAAAAVNPRAFVRVAQWSPDAPAVDVCFAPQGGSFSGQMPRLAATHPAIDSGAAGLVFPRVTSYFALSPGAYTVRLVTAGASNCDAKIQDLSPLPFEDTTYTTIAAIGEVTPVGMDRPLQLVSFADDAAAPSGQIALRFINASPSMTAVDLGTNSIENQMFSGLFVDVGFGQAGGAAGSDAGAIDDNGYLASNALSGATLSAHATPTETDAAIANNVTIAAGSAATVALVDGVTNGSVAKLLLCADGANATVQGSFSDCALISP
jgi:FlaG/FlaF family flagellin (archaellin)